MPLLMLLVAMLLAATMGYAIQRGATCTVAAVNELMVKKRAHRLRALLEAAIWVLGGLSIARALGFQAPTPVGYAVTAWTVLGAALLGMGAVINGACVFGAVARFGSGEWAYLATPVGFFFGCLLGQVFFASCEPRQLVEPALALKAPGALVWALCAWMIWRLAGLLRRGSDANEPWLKSLVSKVWQPHAATLVIAVTFFLLLWLVGPWAYTDVLIEWSKGKVENIVSRGLLLLALLAGAGLGGWTAGKFRRLRISLLSVARYLAGGALMGLGSVMTPGGNDGLILTGMPLLWPYAWLAFAVMSLTIAATLKITRMKIA